MSYQEPTYLPLTIAMTEPTANPMSYGQAWRTPAVAWETFVKYVLPPFIIVLGLVGNTLAFLVFYSEKKESSATFLLRMLAITDFIFLASYACVWLMYLNLSNYVPRFILVKGLPETFLKYVDRIKTWALTSCTWMICLITIDRFVHIYRPLVAIRLNMLLYVKIGFACVNICSIVAAGADVVIIIPQRNDQGEYNFKFLDGVDPHKFYSLKNLIMVNVNRFIPMCIIVPFNTANIILLQKRTREMSHVTNNNKKENSSTNIMILLVVVVFTILAIPACLFRITFVIDRKLALTTGVRPTYFTCLLLNSAINFVIYFAAGRDFRQKLRKVIRKENVSAKSTVENTKSEKMVNEGGNI